MTEPPRDLPPPFSSPSSPPYPAGGDPSHPTYQLGSAPVGPPPVTAPPAYGPITTQRSRVVVIGAVVTAVAVLLCGLCGVAGFLLARDSDNGNKAAPARSSPRPAPSPTAAQGKHTIVYEVSGDGSAIVTYLAPGGPKPDQVSLPWRQELTVDRGSFLATVFAFRFEGGTIECRVLVDGQEVAKDSSDNEVTCTHVIAD
jgi:hypothetical protein